MWLTLRGRKTARSLFPKIVAADLKEFPILKSFNERKKELAAFARETNRTKELEEKIDTLIFNMYEVEK
jgi:hypothetical protein